MRSRVKIEKRMNDHSEFCMQTGRTPGYDDVMIELLLDIRDLLTPKDKPKTKSKDKNYEKHLSG